MSLSEPSVTLTRRRFALSLMALAGLAGCGFRPLYGDDGAMFTLRDRLQFDTPQTVEGFRMRERLQDRLGQTDAPAYILTTTLGIGQRSAAITREGTTVRLALEGTAGWSLRAVGSDVVLAEGSVDTFTSYSASGTTIATSTAETDARARLATALADLVITRLSIAAQDL